MKNNHPPHARHNQLATTKVTTNFFGRVVALCCCGEKTGHLIDRKTARARSTCVATARRMPASEDYYAILGVTTTASTADIRNAYKEKAMQHHPDRGGEKAVWDAIQKAFDTLSDLQRRASYDRTKQDEPEGGAERQFQAKFGEGAFDLSDSAVSARPKKGGLNIMQKMAEVKKDEERLKQSNRTAVIQTGFEMSHSAGFEAWLRNQEGLGKMGAYNAEDLVKSGRMYGGGGVGAQGLAVEATDSTARPLPPLKTTAIRYDRHGAPEEVLYVDKAVALPRSSSTGKSSCACSRRASTTRTSSACRRR